MTLGQMSDTIHVVFISKCRICLQAKPPDRCNMFIPPIPPIGESPGSKFLNMKTHIQESYKHVLQGRSAASGRRASTLSYMSLNMYMKICNSDTHLIDIQRYAAIVATHCQDSMVKSLSSKFLMHSFICLKMNYRVVKAYI